MQTETTKKTKNDRIKDKWKATGLLQGLSEIKDEESGLSEENIAANFFERTCAALLGSDVAVANKKIGNCVLPIARLLFDKSKEVGNGIACHRSFYHTFEKWFVENDASNMEEQQIVNKFLDFYTHGEL